MEVINKTNPPEGHSFGGALPWKRKAGRLPSQKEGGRSRSLTLRRTLYWLSGLPPPSCCASDFTIQIKVSKLTTAQRHYTNPKDAAAAAERLLYSHLGDLNKGINQVDNAGQEIDKVNNILNKHLND